MAIRIYVGKLPYSTTDQELNEMFAQYGSVESAKVVMDNYAQPQPQSKGFGFVEMPDDAEARAAIEALNGFQVGRMSLVVNEARPREARPEGGAGGGGYRGNGGGNAGGGYAPRGNDNYQSNDR